MDFTPYLRDATPASTDLARVHPTPNERPDEVCATHNLTALDLLIALLTYPHRLDPLFQHPMRFRFLYRRAGTLMVGNGTCLLLIQPERLLSAQSISRFEFLGKIRESFQGKSSFYCLSSIRKRLQFLLDGKHIAPTFFSLHTVELAQEAQKQSRLSIRSQ